MANTKEKRPDVSLSCLLERADEIVSTSVTGRPRIDSDYIPKVDAKIRVSVEVMEWIRSKGPRHYSRINGLLTALMEAELEQISRKRKKT